MKISEIEQKQINEKLNTLKELDIVQETEIPSLIKNRYGVDVEL